MLEKITAIVGEENVLSDEAMSKHTTFRVGGNADFFVTPNGKQEAADIVRLLLSEKYPFYVVGNGSNLLVSDAGFRGCIICISKGMDEIVVDGNEIKAGAGALLAKVTRMAAKSALDGLVFASGIPGSVGGAMVMNAGAYGGEMKDVVKEVELLDIDSGEILTVSNEAMEFSYRSSIVKKHPYIVLSATFSLKPGNTEEILLGMEELANKRREKQPLEYPSAGSTFKRPEGYFAGKLIEDAGLKGYRVGGAMVSTKHCGFVINAGNASATDVLTLISDVSDKVYELFSVRLEPEVCILPETI